jgi:aryl-alcohol dehydrogenase-like predicted oxidoreductase
MTDTTRIPNAAAAGAFPIGGDLRVNRLGFGSMQLTGAGVWGDPRDPEEAVRVLRRGVDLGVNLIDTADAYGPFVAERLIKQALHPYPDDLVIATKAGLTRPGPGAWVPDGRPAHLREAVESSLTNLGVERIDLLQLHRVDPKVALEDQIGALKVLQDDGKVRHIGLSEVTVDQLEAASKIAPIVTVQNLYNLTNRSSDELLDHAARLGIGFIPWFPLATGALAGPRSAIAQLASRLGASPSQLALAWLLKRSPAMLPIPGTSSVAHLEENVGAAEIELSDTDFADITAA